MKHTRAGATRDRAEAAFHGFLELVQAGTAPEPEAFVLQQDPAIHAELREILSDWQALRGRLGAQPSAVAGQAVGDFELVRELGRGGMGVVWEAQQRSLDRRVALKLLAAHTAFSPSSLQRFQREASAAARLEHPGIVRVYEVGEAGGVHFIAQELIEDGSTLEDLLAEQRVELELPADWYRRMAELFAAAAEALQHAHQRGVIHRDVKPSNLLLGEGGAPKLADFGLAKVLDRPSLSRTLELAGTPYYMSPEQAAAKAMGIDARTDVFSLGATLYEALTLRRPFEGDTLEQIFRQILTVDPPEPRTLRSRVPRELAIVCLKAIEKDRERRYASAGELAADLRRWLKHEPILARPPGPLARAAKWTKRHPVVTAAGGVAVVALTVITTLLVEVSAQRDAKDVALGAKEEALEEKDLALGERGAALEAKDQAIGARERLLRSTDSVRLAAAARAALSKDSGLALALAIEAAERNPGVVQYDALIEALRVPLEARILAGHTEEVTWAQWSADGDRVLTLSDDGSCRVWEVESGETTLMVKAVSACFDPTGRRLAIASPDGTAAVLEIETGTVLTEYVRLDESSELAERVLSVAFDPTGFKVLSLLQAQNRRAACVWSAVTGQGDVDFPATEGSWLNLPVWSSDGRRVAFTVEKEVGDDEVQVWSVQGPELIASLRGSGEQVHFNANGSWVAATGNGGAQIWELATGKQLLDRPDDESGGALSPDETRLVTIEEKLLRIWDTATGELVAECGGAEDDIRNAVFSPDGEKVAGASEDGTARIWSTPDGRQLEVLRGHSDKVGLALFSPDGSRLLTTSEDSTARVWVVGQPTAVVEFDSPYGSSMAFCDRRGWVLTAGTRGEVEARSALDGGLIREFVRVLEDQSFGGDARVLVSPDERFLVTRVGLSWPTIWDLETGEPVTHPDLGQSWCEDACFSADGQRLAIRNREGIDVWDMGGGRLLAHMTQPGKWGDALAFTPGGERLAWSSSGAVVHLWEVPSGTPIQIPVDSSSYATSLCFSESGALLLLTTTKRSVSLTTNLEEAGRLWKRRATHGYSSNPDGSYDVGFVARSGSAHLLDARTGAVMHVMDIDDSFTNQVEGIQFDAFGPRDELALVAAGDAVHLWDLASGARRHVLRGHGSDVRFAHFLDDGASLLAIAADGIATLWDTATGAERYAMHVDPEGAWAADVSADGQRLAITGRGDRVRIQPVDPLAAARARKPRTLTPWERGEHRVLGIEALTIQSRLDDPLEADSALMDLRTELGRDALAPLVASDLVQVLRLALERDSGARAAKLHELVELAFAKSGDTDPYVAHLHALRPALEDEPEIALVELERALGLCSENDLDLHERIWKDQGLILSRHPEARKALNPPAPGNETR